MSRITDMPFDFARVDIEDRSTLVVFGELDMVSSVRLHEALRSMIEEEHKSSLEIDLADVTFIDSGGLGTLVSADRHLRKRGGHLRIVAISERAARVFETTGLASRFSLPKTTGPTGTPGSYFQMKSPLLADLRDEEPRGER